MYAIRLIESRIIAFEFDGSQGILPDCVRTAIIYDRQPVILAADLADLLPLGITKRDVDVVPVFHPEAMEAEVVV